MGHLDNVAAGIGQMKEQAKSAAGHILGKDVRINSARILTVNIRDYTVDVRTEHNQTFQFDLPFMVPYCHPANGEGINFMPEVGSTCYYCEPSDAGVKGFVMGWLMIDDGSGAYRAGRELLNPGDIHLSTRDGNFVFLRRGGIIQIGATPICQTVYLPIRNILQQFCENYELHAPGGDLTWTVNRQDEDMEGHKGTLFTIAAHEYADDPIKDPLAILKIGSHGDGNPTILTLQTRDKGGGAVQVELTIDKTGEVDWTVQKTVIFDFKQDFTLLVGRTCGLAGQIINLQASTQVNVQAPQIAFEAGNLSMVLTESGGSISGGPLNLGDAEDPALKNSSDFKQWMNQVTQALNGPGPGQPVISPTTPIKPPIQHVSTKVKV